MSRHHFLNYIGNPFFNIFDRFRMQLTIHHVGSSVLAAMNQKTETCTIVQVAEN